MRVHNSVGCAFKLSMLKKEWAMKPHANNVLLFASKGLFTYEYTNKALVKYRGDNFCADIYL